MTSPTVLISISITFTALTALLANFAVLDRDFAQGTLALASGIAAVACYIASLWLDSSPRQRNASEERSGVKVPTLTSSRRSSSSAAPTAGTFETQPRSGQR